MSPFATSNAVQPSLASPATSTWHVGISPAFPPSLILTNDAAIESLLTDIPYLSVGLLGFGVLTFFFAMRKFNRLSCYVFVSVIVAFIAGVLDVSQVLTRGKEDTDLDTNVSSVLPLLVARELALSVSIGIRFLFFWAFVSQPPRGELLPSTNDCEPQRLNLIHMESDIHSGNWMRLGYVGGFLKYSLLLAVLFVPLLQILWRVVGDLSKVGPVYIGDSALEVALSSLFVVKIFTNVCLSPLTPRWKTIRDYSPVIGALLIGLGVGVGNIMQFQFSETSLGRLFQAIQLYILVLYIHVTSFYERRTRISMFGPTIEDLPNQATMAVEDIKTCKYMSTLQTNPATTSAARNVASDIARPPGTLYTRPNNRLSTWLIAEAEQSPVIQIPPRNMSPMGRLTSLINGRKNSAGHDRAPCRLWTGKEIESRTATVSANARFAATIPSNQRRGGNKMTLDTSSFGIRNGTSPDGTIASFAAVENYSRDDLTPPTKVPRLPGSPIYGLDGIMRYHGQSSPLSRPSSVQSSGMESLLRQQADLDQSVAELQLFSPVSVTSGERPTVPGGLSSSRSDFSLRHLPGPPPSLPYRLVNEDFWDVSRVDASDDKQPQQVMPRVSIIAKPQITYSGRRQSFVPSSARSSTDAAVLGVANRTILGSGGYDATSFVGNLTLPESVSQADKSRPPSLPVERLDTEEILTGPLADVTTSVVLQIQHRPLPVIPEVDAYASAKSSLPRRMEQGLHNAVKLNISGPIRQPSIERSTAYERPRPVPQTK